MPADPSVVDDDVEAAQILTSPLHDLGCNAKVGDVARDSDVWTTREGDECFLRSLVIRAVAKSDPSTTSGEGLSYCTPDTSSTTCDQHAFFEEVHPPV